MNSPTPSKNGGARPGAGRPKGALSKIAEEAREKAKSTGQLPHEFLLSIARGEAIFREEIDPASGRVVKVQEQYDFDARKDAAKAAAPYYAPKISTVEVIHGVTDDELDNIIKVLAAETGLSTGDGGEEQEAQSPPCPTSRGRVKLIE